MLEGLSLLDKVRAGGQPDTSNWQQSNRELLYPDNAACQNLIAKVERLRRHDNASVTRRTLQEHVQKFDCEGKWLRRVADIRRQWQAHKEVGN
jgi:hypothetical protein